MNDFSYLPADQIYLDSACQSLRPQPVIDALTTYYTEHNSCGERVKYKWGKITDEKVDATRQKLLKYLHLSPRHYAVSFTTNTTYGINLLLNQFKPSLFQTVITSDIEHNSPFLSTVAFAKKHNIPRIVLDRAPDGSLPEDADFTRALVVVNCASNIDGRVLPNLKNLIKKIHKQGGTVIIDAAQAMAHNSDILQKTEADAICFSAHKMYAPSLGGIIFRRDLLEKLDLTFIGGGMVDDADLDAFTLSHTNPDLVHTALEPGLQAWGEIIALGAAIDWLDSLPKSAHASLRENSQTLYDFLSEHPKVHLMNPHPTPTLSFHIDGLDSHLLGTALSGANIMARTGYFCCHYYLSHKLNLPPLTRFSLGYHTRDTDIEKTIEVLSRL